MPVPELQTELISREPWGTLQGQEVELFTLSNKHGHSVQVCPFGGIIVSINVPDRHGKLGDVVLGYHDPHSYEMNDCYLGCAVGRYANRIANGKFSIDGEEFTLAQNNGEHSLHGGPNGFQLQHHDAVEVRNDFGVGVKLSRTSPDGEEGFPGNLDYSITYLFNKEGELLVEFHATTDKPTLVNLAQHSYFNLDGQNGLTIGNHMVAINADNYVPVDQDCIPYGEYESVARTPFNLRDPKIIGEVLKEFEDTNAQLQNGQGFDHSFALRSQNGFGPDGDLSLAAQASEPNSGRRLTVYTTEPGVQFYTGNHIPGIVGKGGVNYPRRGGLCFETQKHPDSPNQENFSSAILRPDEEYHSKTIYHFETC